MKLNIKNLLHMLTQSAIITLNNDTPGGIMKRLLSIFLIISMLFVFTACNTIEGLKKDLGLPFGKGTENKEDDKTSTDDGNGTGNTDNGNTPTYTYTDFTDEEKALMNERIGLVIPFIPNNEYSVEEHEYSEDGYGEYGICFYTFDNTEEEFEAYLEKFSEYTHDGTYEDEYGDTWYCYSKGDVLIDVSYYYNEGYIIDLYAYLETDGTGSGNNGGTTVSTKEDEWRKTYDCITVSEALEICEQVGNNVSSQRYYIIATITSISSTEYGEMMIEDSTGEIYVYGVQSADETLKFNELASKPTVGDVVLLYAALKNHNDSLCEVQSGLLIDFYTPKSSDSGNTGTGSGNTGDTATGTKEDEWRKTYDCITVGEALDICEQVGNNVSSQRYYIIATITSISSTEYGEMMIEDSTGEIYVYGVQSADGTLKFNELASKPAVGDVVLLYAALKNHNNSLCEVQSGLLIDFYTPKSSDSGNTGTGSGNTGSGNTGSTNTNLPTGVNGVHSINFKQATKVKDVTDQGYYLDGCPTTGSPAVLVIPVEFSNKTAASTGYSISDLKDAFTKVDSTDGFFSIYEYYYISSYEQLSLDITVLDSWFKPANNSSYYESSTDSDGYSNGDQLIMDEALAYLEDTMDLSKFDSDSNGIIDAVIMINTLDVDSEKDFQWAYRYWNYHTDSDGYYYEYDGVSANDYMWASYQFLHEGYDASGNVNYNDTDAMSTYTFIHEFGHILGVDDYYDTEGESDPMGGCDVMDAMLGDHNAYSKFNLGWITTSRLVVTSTSVSLILEDFSVDGDTIIIANSWDDSLGAYQEYYVIMYYKNTGLNDHDMGGGYFERNGIVVYHVNAALTSEVYEGETYYDVANNNTTYTDSDGYGTKDNLIEYVTSSAGNYTYVVGDTLPSVTDDLGEKLGYTFTVTELEDSYATISFTKI